MVNDVGESLQRERCLLKVLPERCQTQERTGDISRQNSKSNIAFRILAGYVTSPLLRLATLWQNFQETSLSLERLSDIVDHPEEIEIAGEQLPPLPPVQGAITYEGVNFRFAIAKRKLTPS